jgi:2-dehydropantoate 2-reductase
MKILVLGTGAVGGYFGGRLAKAGNELFFTARGANLSALANDGLNVKSIDGNFEIKIDVREKFDRIDGLDLILLCAKTGDTRRLLPVIKEQMNDTSVVVSLQNGVESESILEEAVPKGSIVGGIAFIGSNRYAPGRIRHTGGGSITLGELFGEKTERIERVRKMFADAGVECRVTAKIIKAKWEKLVWNAGFNGLAAITGLSAEKLLSFKPARGIVSRLMEETIAVAQGKSVPVDPSTGDRHIEFTEKMRDVIPSMLQDIRAGRITEIDSINGLVCREGEKAGIATPYNEFVWAAVSAIDETRRT